MSELSEGVDWETIEQGVDILLKRIRSLESQLAQALRERDEARAREAALRDKAAKWAEIKKRSWESLSVEDKREAWLADESLVIALSTPSPAYDEWKAMQAELEARREVMAQMCFNEGYGDQAKFDAAWSKLEKALAVLEEVSSNP